MNSVKEGLISKKKQQPQLSLGKKTAEKIWHWMKRIADNIGQNAESINNCLKEIK